MNTKYILEVLDELELESKRIDAEVSRIQGRCVEDGDFLTFSQSYVIGKSSTRISLFLQEIKSLIEDSMF